MKKNIAIFASGGGSNAEAIIQYFKDKEDVNVELILSNKASAYVLERAQKHHIKSIVFKRSEFYNTSDIVNKLNEAKIDLIVLAGFLWLIPENLIEAFPSRIINIHPALLPKYGGKGMYGHHVHQAVFDNNERESGITIHYVDQNYDEGKVLFQESVSLLPQDTPDIIAKKVLELEHRHYPQVIEGILGRL